MARLFRDHVWVLVVAIILMVAVHFVLDSGRFMTCIWGLIAAVTLFWMREIHSVVYGLTEIVAGVFILAQTYPSGRGGFSNGFSNGFQTLQSNVVLVATLGAVYVMVRGFDNVKRGMSPR